MNDLKKTFAAGFVVLMILLFTPYYLQLIGYQETISVTEAPAVVHIEPSSENPPEHKNGDFNDDSASSRGAETILDQIIQIESPLYEASLSTIGGGSFERYVLVPRWKQQICWRLYR